MEDLGLHIVLLIDEFENVGDNDNFGPDFYYGLRSLAIHHDLALITSTRVDLVEIAHSDEVRSSPFFNIFATINLQPLSPEPAPNRASGDNPGCAGEWTFPRRVLPTIASISPGCTSRETSFNA